MTNDLQLAERDRNLAQKSSWITGVLTFFLPPFGHIYTGRYKALLISFAILVGTIGLVNSSDDDDAGLGVIYLVATTVENTRAVLQAKKRTLGTATVPAIGTIKPARNLKVEILKFMKGKEEVSLSDLVIETELDSRDIMVILNELERESLIRGYNRASDGAVVYRAI